MRIAMILNQVQAGVGTKDDVDVTLTATKEALGPGVTLRPMLKEQGKSLLVTIYLGDRTYTNDKEVIHRKIKGMLARLQIDALICGPSFNYPEFSQMCAEIAKDINETTQVKAICAMSQEMQEVISTYKDSLEIVKMPKKGGVGLNQSYEAIGQLLAAKETGSDKTTYASLVY